MTTPIDTFVAVISILSIIVALVIGVPAIIRESRKRRSESGSQTESKFGVSEIAKRLKKPNESSQVESKPRQPKIERKSLFSFRRKEEPKATMSNSRVPETVPTGKKVKVKMTRVIDDKGRKKRVVTSTLNIQLKNTLTKRGMRFFKARIGIPGMEWGAFHLDMTCQDKNGEVTYDEMYNEPINPRDGKIHRSFDVSIIMANAFVVQGIEIATILSSFVFTKRHLIIVAASITISALFVGSLNPIFHFVPITEVHFVPSLPRQAP